MFFCASIAYNPSDQEISLLILLAGITSLLVLLNLITAIWDRVRRKPSIEQETPAVRREAAATFALKSELAAAEDRLSNQISGAQADRRESIGKLDTRISEVRATLDQGLSEIRRSLGRVEGKLENSQ